MNGKKPAVIVFISLLKADFKKGLGHNVQSNNEKGQKKPHIAMNRKSTENIPPLQFSLQTSLKVLVLKQLSSLNFLFTQRQLQIYTQYRTHWSGCI
jgi:hypothetical protein